MEMFRSSDIASSPVSKYSIITISWNGSGHQIELNPRDVNSTLNLVFLMYYYKLHVLIFDLELAFY